MTVATIYSERMMSRWEKELGTCATELGIPLAIFRRQDVEYPLEKYYRLLECGSRCCRSDIGAAIGKSMKPGDIGAVGHAMAATATLGEAFGLAARYLYVLSHGNTIRLNTGRQRAVISYSLNDQFSAIHRQDIELATSFLVSAARELSGRNISPQWVELEHEKPSHARELQSHFGCDVQYGRSGNRLHYHKKILKLPVLSSDPSLLEALQFFLDERLKLRDEEEDMLPRVRHLIVVSLNDGPPEIDQVASSLGIGRRTLQRRLAAAGLVFSDLVDEIRRGLAADYVKNFEYSLTDIALMLGYSELSAFSRAFRRWTGKSPQEVREATA